MPLAAQRRARRVAAAVIPTAALLATALSPAIPAEAAAAAATATATVNVYHPTWASASADKGAVPAATKVTARIYLASKDTAGLAAYAKAVSDTSSPLYGQFLSTAEAAARFGPSAAHTATLTAYLASHGIEVTSTTAHYLDISATASQIQAAFGARLDNYSTSTGTHRAPAGDLTLPTDVAASVLSVEGLDGITNTAARPDSTSVAKSIGEGSSTATKGGIPATGVPEPCSTFWGQYTATGFPAGYTPTTPTAPCSYFPSQLRTAYGVSQTGLTGKGATIAIVDAYGSSTMLADANQYATNHGDAPFRAGQYSEWVTPANWELQAACGGPGGWAPEEALDVEMSHGLAPDANVVYVGANSCSDADLLSAWQLIVDNHLADIVSNSFGEIMHGPAGYFDTSIIAPYNQTLEQAAVEGIGFNASSGDCGDNSPAAASTGVNCDPNTTEPQTQWPASSTWITAVGGTALTISNSSGKYDFETAMGDDRSVLSADGSSWLPFPGHFYFGGGGGTVEDFTQPWYQAGAVPGRLSHHLLTGATSRTAHRVLPDVAMNGDLITSVLVGISDGSPYSEGGFGGTSVSSPSFAGVLADAIQARGDFPLGFANPALYARQGLYTDVTENPFATGLKNGQTLSAILDLGLNTDGTRRVRDYAFGKDFGLTATWGFDNVTGLGSPNARFLESFKFGSDK
jgi:subtilase family serine protease